MICSLFVSLAMTSLSWADVTAVDRPDTQTRNKHYVSNREPLSPTPLVKLPIRAIRPEGWLRKQIELQAVGFHGHLGEISSFLVKEGNAWLNPKGGAKAGWEEVPYWLKGFANAAYLTGDEKQIQEAKTWIEAAIASQQPDGWFGPESNRTRVNGAADLWPNMIMLFCLQDYHDFAGDDRIPALMTRYFKHLTTIPEDKFLPDYWDQMRGGDLLSSVYWLYNRTGEEWLLELAEKVHRKTARWDTDVINWHNVNMAQGFGEPTTFWQQSKQAAHFDASYRNFDKMRAMYGQVPGGLFGGDENCRPGHDDPRQAVETCGMAEMMLSTERLTCVTGDLLWADRCEDVAFNSLPAALTADMRALRYLTAPNLAVSDAKSKSPGYQNGGPMLLMDPHQHRCCQHNWGHAWPYLAEHLWFATPDNGLAAIFFCDSRVTAKVGDGGEVTIDQNTHYPFDEHVEFVVNAASDIAFPLYLRVPGWCSKPEVSVNDEAAGVQTKPHQYIRIARTWRNGDVVRLTLPMEIRIRCWEKNHGSVSVDRGPLTYSLKIGERAVQVTDRGGWDAYEIHPTTPWNYGLVFDAEQPAKSFEVVKKEWPGDDMPFTHEGNVVELRASGKRIPQWQLDVFGLVAELQDSPARSDQPVEPITLIPMGAARLRISAFPVIGEGPGAKAWQAPPEPAYQASASHCWHSDTVQALADGRLPKRSDDNDIPRMTWWPNKGSAEWVQADFSAPRKVSSVEVYWFDDTGRGQCRVPESCRFVYRDGSQWKPVVTSDTLDVARDKANRLSFEAVTTNALRLEVQLQQGFSAGILEWKVE
jgi:hypothetical protein